MIHIITDGIMINFIDSWLIFFLKHFFLPVLSTFFGGGALALVTLWIKNHRNNKILKVEYKDKISEFQRESIAQTFNNVVDKIL